MPRSTVSGCWELWALRDFWSRDEGGENRNMNVARGVRCASENCWLRKELMQKFLLALGDVCAQ